METEHLNGHAGNGETTSVAGVKTTARANITTLWQPLTTKKLLVVATVGTALISGVGYVARWSVVQKL